MTYGYYSNKRGRKSSRSKTKQLEVRRILASLAMAAGIFAYPFGIGEAADPAIIRKGETEAIRPSNNVYNIDPEGKSADGKFAYNRFQQFALDVGQIANLKFGSGTNDAATLANLVQNKIEINGIVNAVKNNKIDGHLIFLSPKGIAVGANGVINAGQFTGIVPTPNAFNTLYNASDTDAATVITMDAINQIKNGTYAAVKTDAEGAVVQGAIEISGQINTHSGIMLGAGVININNGAKLRSTKDVQFGEVVNTGSNSGLTFATDGTGGDIILTAKQESRVKDTDNNTQNAHAIRWSERSTDLSAAVNIGQNVIITNKDKAVKLTAESTSTYELSLGTNRLLSMDSLTSWLRRKPERTSISLSTIPIRRARRLSTLGRTAPLRATVSTLKRNPRWISSSLLPVVQRVRRTAAAIRCRATPR